MTRLLILAALLVALWIALELLWRWGRRRLREALGMPRDGQRSTSRGPAGREATVRGRLVRCAACGVAVPQERSLAGTRLARPARFCSEACRGQVRDAAGLG